MCKDDRAPRLSRCRGGAGGRPRRWATAIAAGALLFLGTVPASTALPLPSRRHWAYLSLASGGWCIGESWQAHDRADRMRDRIAGGGTPAQLQSWKTERRRADKRTQAMLGLAGGAVATGVYLWRTPGPEALPDPELGVAAVDLRGTRLALVGDPGRQRAAVRLSRSF